MMPAYSKSRLLRVLALSALLLWAGGIAASTFRLPVAGETLRWIAIGLLLPVAVRMSSLTLWTFLAMMAGAELGVDLPHIAVKAHSLGELFLRLVSLLVAPLIFATITTGVAAHGQLRSIGRVAVKSVVYFEIVTTLGLIIGTVAMNISGAGWGLTLPAVEPAASVMAVQTWQQMILRMVPENIAQAVAQNEILQVAVFSLMFGCALALLPEQKRAPLITILQSLTDAMFQLTRIIMYLAPLAAGAALAYTIGGAGLAMLLPLGKLIVTFYTALAFLCLFVLVPILLLFRIPIRRFVAAAGEPAAIGFATTAASASLPLAMERMEEFGVPRWIVSFVIPIGFSFNMDGSSVYLSMAAVFTAQAAGIHLSVRDQITMLITLAIASKGVATVPRAVLIVLLATASSIHIPTAPVLMILGIDILMDMGRTAINVVGNCMASVVIARSERVLSDGWNH